MLLESFYSECYSPQCLRSRSKDTKRLYLTSIANFGRFLERRPVLADLNDATVNRYLDYFRQLPRSPYTTNKERSNLLAMWRFACRKGHLEEWPDVEAEPQPERIPQAWTDAEVFRIFAALAALKGDVAGLPASDWWRALLLVIWCSGERIGAVMQIQWASVDLSSAWLIVPAEHRKNRRADKLYKLSAEAVDALRAIRNPPRDLVFEWKKSRTYLWQQMGVILKSAGLPSSGRDKFHRLRRTVATYYAAAGGDVQELLGHADARMAKRHYLDPRMLSKTHAADLLFRPDRGPDAA
jgi:integrase